MSNQETLYETRRNELIVIAERHANEVAGRDFVFEGQRKKDLYEARDKWCEKWNRAFHDKMNQLAQSVKEKNSNNTIICASGFYIDAEYGEARYKIEWEGRELTKDERRRMQANLHNIIKRRARKNA